MTGQMLMFRLGAELLEQLELDFSDDAAAGYQPAAAAVPAAVPCGYCGLVHSTYAGTPLIEGCPAYEAERGNTPAPCGCCARRWNEQHHGHAYRPEGSARPRGEVRFPAGSLVRVVGGPKWCRGALGEVLEVESPTMRAIDLGQLGAPSGTFERIGVKGLELCDGRP